MNPLSYDGTPAFTFITFVLATTSPQGIVTFDVNFIFTNVTVHSLDSLSSKLLQRHFTVDYNTTLGTTKLLLY